MAFISILFIDIVIVMVFNPQMAARYTEGEYSHIMEYGVLPVSSEQQQSRTEALQTQLHNNEGQFVLAVVRRWVDVSPFPRRQRGIIENVSKFHSIHTAQYLGIVTAPFMDLQDGAITLHTPKYAFSPDDSDPRTRSAVGVEVFTDDRNIGSHTTNRMHIRNLENPLIQGDRTVLDFGDGVRGEALEVIVGDETVQNWRELYAEEPRLMAQYGISGIERIKQNAFIYDNERDQNNEFGKRNSLEVFARMQEALGRDPMPTHSEIMEQLENEKEIRKRIVLSQLDTMGSLIEEYLGSKDDPSLPQVVGERRQLESSFRMIMREAHDLGLTEKGFEIVVPVSPGKEVHYKHEFVADVVEKFTEL